MKQPSSIFLVLITINFYVSCSSNSTNKQTAEDSATAQKEPNKKDMDSTLTKEKETLDSLKNLQSGKTWNYSDIPDVMDNSVSHLAVLYSANTILTGSGDAKGILSIVRQRGHTSVAVSLTKGSFWYTRSSGDWFDVKFDGGKTEHESIVHVPPSPEYEGIYNSSAFLERIKSSSKLLIEPSVYHGGGVLEFNIAGLKWNY
jgi:hypothetical protein